MVVDSGADACFFDHNLTVPLGFNPVQGGRISKVQALATEHPTAWFPVQVRFPQLDMQWEINAGFTQLQGGWNGVLGHEGFFDRFERVTFVPGQYFELTAK